MPIEQYFKNHLKVRENRSPLMRSKLKAAFYHYLIFLSIAKRGGGAEH